jgi:cytochrome c553
MARASLTFLAALAAAGAADHVGWADEAGGTAAESPTGAADAPHFESDVLPLLREHCAHCHGSDAPQESELDVTSLAALLRGGANGPAVVPGDASASLLVDAVAQGDMPPDGEPPLDPSAVDLLRRWVAAGAPADERVAPRTSERAPRRHPHWAFQRLVRPAAPLAVGDDGRPAGPIDAFLIARLAERNLHFSPPADREALARRAYFDLWGLPPTPEQTRAFRDDASPQAFATLVDRLLASPEFGVKWARYWLDVVGYVDTVSFDSDLGNPEGFYDGKWRYRDYVIDAFNRDKPLDAMIRQQIAGDESVAWRTAAEYTPEIVENLVATGYFRCVEDLTGEDLRPVTVWSVVHETISQVGTSLLGLSLNCARCHNHKFEPISQTDYYRLMAVMAPAFNPDDWKGPKDRSLADIPVAQRRQIDAENAELDKLIQPHLDRLAELRRPLERALRAELLVPMGDAIRQKVLAALDAPEAQRTPQQKVLLLEFEQLLKIPPEKIDALFSAEQREQARAEQEAIDAIHARQRGYGVIHAVYDVGPPPTTRFHQGGSYDSQRRPVAPGFVEVLLPERDWLASTAAGLPPENSGRRTALGRWLTDLESPAAALVARVFVNRVWERLMGRGIVHPSDNLGVSGSPPTHPELLEWLAADFVEHGWSVKRLIRQIVLTDAYRQASAPAIDDPGAQVARRSDPDNLLLWRARLRRIEGEALRDAILHISGALNPLRGGPPVPLTVGPEGSLVVDAQRVARPDDGFRRSLYLLNRRIYSTSFLMVFDKPVVTGCVGQRDDSAPPLQSLTMLNDPLVLEESRRFAERVVAAAGSDDAAQIELAFRTVFGRHPTPAETQWSRESLDRQRAIHAAHAEPEAGPSASGQDGAPRPREAAVRVAALAGVCQAYFGSSEFLYLP